MSSRGGTTLYVTGFGPGTRARDLAYEFERFGRLVRCDIPAPRSASSRLFAFVEYESRRDSDDAYHDMHNTRIGRDDVLKIEWARTPPSASWRFDRGDPRGGGRRDRSPRRARSGSPPRRRYDDERDRDYEPRDRDRRDRRDRDRSRSPDDRDRDIKRERDDDRERERDNPRERDGYETRETGTNGDDRKDRDEPEERDEAPQTHEDLDTAE